MSTRRHLLITSLGFWSPVALAQPETLVIATGELPPLVSEQPGLSFLSSLFTEIGKIMGVRFEFRFMPWKRCELAVERLEAWGAIPYVPTPERELKFSFSDRLYLKQTKFFAYQSEGPGKAIRFDTLNDLKGLRIGGVRGYFYEQMFLEAGLQVEWVASEEQSLRQLRRGRIDLAAALDFVGWQLIRQLFPADEVARFSTLPKAFHTGANYLMSSRAHPANPRLLMQFNAALRQVKDSGSFQKVATSHGLVLPP